MSEIINKNEVEKQIAALKSKISYLKSKRTKVCARCGKEFAPANSMKEKYCSDECRKLAIQETKHKSYLKNREKPEYIEKMKAYKHAWLERTGRLKPKTVSYEEYQNLKAANEGLSQAYDKFYKQYVEIVKENMRLIQENHELRNKTFVQKLKDLL